MKTLLLISVSSILFLNVSAQNSFLKTYGGLGTQEGHCVRQTSDGGYIIAGFSSMDYNSDAYLIKTDANGNPSWEKTLNYTYGSEYGNSLVALDADQGHGYAVLATIAFDESSASGDDMFLVRLDEAGDSLWTKKYGGVNDERGLCIQKTPDNGFILAGSSTSYGNGSWNALLVKTDSDGNVEWMKDYGGDQDEFATHVQNTMDGGFILTGQIDNGDPSNKDIYLVLTDSNGVTIWTRSVDIADSDRGTWIEQTSDGGYILTGYSELPTAAKYEVCLIKLNSNGMVLGSDELQKTIPKIRVSQNSSQHTVTLDYELNASSLVSISLFNISGQKVVSILNEKQDSGMKKMTLSTEGLLPGVYVGSLTVNKVPSNFKLILY